MNLHSILFIILILCVCTACNNLDIDEQLSEIKLKIEQDKNNSELYFKRATLYAKKGYRDSSLIDLNNAILIDSTNNDYLIARANLLELNGDYLQANSDYLKLYNRDAEDMNLVSFAINYLFLKKYKEANLLFNQSDVLKKMKDKDLYYKALSNLFSKNIDAAILDFVDYLNRFPNDRDVKLKLAELYLIKEDYKNCQELITSISNLPKYYTGVLKFKEVKLAESKKYFLESINDGSYSMGYLYLINIHLSKSKRISVDELLNKAIENGTLETYYFIQNKIVSNIKKVVFQKKFIKNKVRLEEFLELNNKINNLNEIDSEEFLTKILNRRIEIWGRKDRLNEIINLEYLLLKYSFK